MSNENNPTGAGSAQDNLESSKTHARQAADALKTAAQAKVEELRGKAGEYYGQARSQAEGYYEQARSLQEEGEAYVRENPLRAVLMALGAGLVLGMTLRK